jgi:endonuclease G
MCHFDCRQRSLSSITLLSLWMIVTFTTHVYGTSEPPHECTGEFITHTHFVLCYSEEYEQALWVSYELTIDEVINNMVDRTDDFRPDPTVRTGSATLEDYRGSGFDRGHLAPAGDMSFSQVAMSESFYFSNMSPQEPQFNRGIWRKLESKVRDWAVEKGEIIVVTGGIFRNVTEFIGPNRVAVPSLYYKVLLDVSEDRPEGIAFILPNTKGEYDLPAYVRSIDEVEMSIGIDLFPNMEDAIEQRVESSVNLPIWPFESATAANTRASYTPLADDGSAIGKSDVDETSSAPNQNETSSEQKININSATEAQLQQLSGIGPALARRIIETRPYQSVDELLNVSGIGPSKLNTIRPFVTTN